MFDTLYLIIIVIIIALVIKKYFIYCFKDRTVPGTLPMVLKSSKSQG